MTFNTFNEINNDLIINSLKILKYFKIGQLTE